MVSDAEIRYLLDASALLAALNDEPGRDYVTERIGHSAIASVNLAEVVTKLRKEGYALADILDVVDVLRLPVIPLEREDAIYAGDLRQHTLGMQLALGDRACLASAARRNLIVLTSDRIWSQIGSPFQVELIR